MTRLRTPLATLVAALTLSGCGSTPIGFDLADAGAIADGGAPGTDGGGARDGGEGTDGGALADGGALVDGGGIIDGGSRPDGGPRNDGGAFADGGSRLDGGSLVDGGPRNDGGALVDGGARDGGGGGPVGSPCVPGDPCTAGFCLSEQDTGFPGGYCATSCADAAPCPSGAYCWPRYSVCLEACPASGCRDGYACTDQIGPDHLAGPVCVPGRPGAHVGDACQGNGDCQAGGFCVTQSSSNLPGGYCSAGCTLGSSDCGAGATCIDIDGPGGTAAFCAKSCNADTDCPRAGYVCEATWFGAGLSSKVCVPGTRAPVAVGSACATAADCPPSWLCLKDADGFPGGYCTRGCSRTAPGCPQGAFCFFEAELCVTACTGNGDCRGPRYACSDRMFGFATAAETCVPYSPDATIGAACHTAADCTLGGFCIPEVNGQGQPTGLRGGYCSAFCSANGPTCPGDGLCRPFFGQTLCVDGCASTNDCRSADGYQCVRVDSTTRACLPINGG